MSDLALTNIADALAERESYPLDILPDVLAAYNILSACKSRAEMILKELAKEQYRQTGELGFTLGGRETNGKVSGAISVYMTQTKYERIYRPDLWAIWCSENMDADELAAEMQHWAEKCRTDWWQTAVQKRPRFDEFKAAMQVQDDNDGMYPEPVLGEPSLDIRFNSPDLSRVNVLPPIKAAKPKKEKKKDG